MSLLIFVAGLFHFAILIASACVPRVLDWRGQLDKLDRLLRQLVWIYGGYVVLMIVGFGVISVLLPNQLATGEPLARAIAGLIAVFWGIRLALQFFVLDAKPYLTSWRWRAGYHALTVVFTFHTAVYAIAAAAPNWIDSIAR